MNDLPSPAALMPSIRTPVLPPRIPTTVEAAWTTEQLLRRRDALGVGEPDRDALRTRVIEEHLPLARRLAGRYAGRGEAFDDLAQVAATALVKAVDGYECDRNSLFVSYAVPSIVGALRRHFRDSAWGMRVPRATQELVLGIRAADGELAQRLGRPPTDTELADDLHVEPGHVSAARLAQHAYRPGSLDHALSLLDSGVGGGLARSVSITDLRYAEVDNQLLVRALVAGLPERDRQVVIMHFFQDMTQTQIAAVIGVSQMQVSRLLRLTLSRLRLSLTAETEHGAGRRSPVPRTRSGFDRPAPQ